MPPLDETAPVMDMTGWEDVPAPQAPAAPVIPETTDMAGWEDVSTRRGSLRGGARLIADFDAPEIPPAPETGMDPYAAERAADAEARQPRVYETMNPAERAAAQFTSGVHGMAADTTATSMTSAARLLQDMDQIDAGTWQPRPNGQTPGPIQAYQIAQGPQRQRLRAAMERQFGQNVEYILRQRGEAAAQPANPRNAEVRRLVNEGRHGDAWRVFASDPLGMIQQATVSSLPASAAMMAPGVGAAALGAGRMATGLVTYLASAGTELGSQQLENITDAMTRAGVDVNDPRAFSAWVRENPAAMREATQMALRGMNGPAIFDALTLGFGRGIVPGRGVVRNTGRVLTNFGAEVAGEPAGAALGQVLSHGRIHDPGALVDEALGGLGQVGPTTAVGTMQEAQQARAAAGRSPAAPPVPPAPPVPGPAVSPPAPVGAPPEAPPPEATVAAPGAPEAAGAPPAPEGMAPGAPPVSEPPGAASSPLPGAPPVPTAEPGVPSPAPVAAPGPAAPPVPGAAVTPIPGAAPGPAAPVAAPPTGPTAPLPPIAPWQQDNDAAMRDLLTRAPAIAQRIRDLHGQGMVAEQIAAALGEGWTANDVRTARGILGLEALGPVGGLMATIPQEPAAPAPTVNPTTSLTALLNDPRPLAQIQADAAAERQRGIQAMRDVLPPGWSVTEENGQISVLDPNGDWHTQVSNPLSDVEALRAEVAAADAAGVQNGIYPEPNVRTAKTAPFGSPEQTSAAGQLGAQARRRSAEEQARRDIKADLAKRLRKVASGFAALGDADMARDMRQAAFIAAKGGYDRIGVAEAEAALANAQKAATAIDAPTDRNDAISRLRGSLRTIHLKDGRKIGLVQVRGGGWEARLNDNGTITTIGGGTEEQAIEAALREAGFAAAQAPQQAEDDEEDGPRFGTAEMIRDVADANGIVFTEEEMAAAVRLVDQEGLSPHAAIKRVAEEAAQKAEQEAAAAAPPGGEWSEEPQNEPEEQAPGAEPAPASSKPAEPAPEAAPEPATGGEQSGEGEQPTGAADALEREAAAALDALRREVNVRTAEEQEAWDWAEGPSLRYLVDEANDERLEKRQSVRDFLISDMAYRLGVQLPEISADAHPTEEPNAAKVGAAGRSLATRLKDLQAGEQPAGGEYGTPDAPRLVPLAHAFYQAFLTGRRFASIGQARQFAAQLLGGTINPRSKAAKVVDEAIEGGVVLAARQNVSPATPGTKEIRFDRLVDLYERQPKLDVRTSDSVQRQAYSTPAPLAYLAAFIARAGRASSPLRWLEPTAGTGQLLITAQPAQITANEIDPGRAEFLREGLNLQKVTEEDATKADFQRGMGDGFDVVIANPPFGVVREDGTGREKRWPMGYTMETTHIDHAISARALAAMKDDGVAVLIVGAPVRDGSREDQRKQAYRAEHHRVFWKFLMDNYRVADHFTVAGALYERQGAGWPVDVIVIAGRGKTEGRRFPHGNLPRIYTSWEGLKDAFSVADTVAALRRAPAGTDNGSVGAPENVPDAGGSADTAAGSPAPAVPAGLPPAGSGEGAGNGGQPAGGRRPKRPAGAAAPGGQVAPGSAAEPDSGRPGVRDGSGDGGPAGGDNAPGGVVAGDTGTGGGKQEAAGGDGQPAGVAAGSVPEGAAPSDVSAAFDKELAALFGEDEPQAPPADAPRQGKVGGKLSAGEVVLTATGRPTTPFPKIDVGSDRKAQNTMRRVDQWLMDNAAAEARARGNDHAAEIFANNRDKPSQADKDGAEAYLFDPEFVEKPRPSILKPLTAPSETTGKSDQPPAEAPSQIRGGDNSKGPRTAGQAAVSAVKNTYESADAAIAALAELFGGGKRLNSGFGWDEETWRAALPMFRKATEKFKAAAKDVGEMMRLLLAELRNVYGLTKEQILAARAYIERFVDGVRKGEISLDAEQEQQAEEKPAEQPGPRARKENTETETRLQTRYEPASNAEAVGTLVPSNMADTMREALRKIESEVGALDEFVAQKLGYDVFDVVGNENRPGYFSAEQVDALALGIFNVDRGAGFIIGDQTGVGKGRFVAAMLRYARLQGLTPIFVTKDPGLYGDMYRDANDIGETDFKALVTNRDLRKKKAVPLPGRRERGEEDGDRSLSSLQPQEYRQAINKMIASGRLPDGYDALFTTYSQMQRVKGQETDRHELFRALAPNAFYVFDEAHEAGGGETRQVTKDGEIIPTRADFVRELLTMARSAVYSTATWAKNPHVTTLYSKTDISLITDDPKELPSVIASGGVPLQQVISNMLVENGQYVRRERSFDGVDVEMAEVGTNLEVAERLAEVLRTAFKTDELMAPIREAWGEAVTSGEEDDGGMDLGGAGVVFDPSLGPASASSVGFASLMHNIIGQGLLSLKSVEAADAIIAAHERGEKPVVALSNTMGAFLQDYADENNLQPGSDVSDFRFNKMIVRYVKRMRRITLKQADAPEGQVTYYWLTDNDIRRFGGDKALRAVREAERLAETTDLGEMPASPVDYLLDRLEQAGIRVGEITGRQLRVQYVIDKETGQRVPRLAGREASTAAKKRAMSEFNSGQLDALIINRSGSTGFSLHASKQFRDQKRRHMFLLQAEPDINIFMQMLGRVHRTGQVVTPKYSIVVSDMPIEKRPAARLMKNLASLNANTSANRESAFTVEGVTDFLNEFGDQVVAQLMRDDPETANLLNIHFPATGDIPDGLAAKATGRFGILPRALQVSLYDQIERNYRNLIETLDRLGQNTLEAKTLELDAKKVSEIELTPQKEGGSVFGAPSFIERLDVKRLGKPMPLEDVQDLVEKNQHDNTVRWAREIFDAAQKEIDAAEKRQGELRWDLDQTEEIEDEREKKHAQDEINAQIDAQERKKNQYRDNRDTLDSLLANRAIGDWVTVRSGSGTNQENYLGRIIDVQWKQHTKSALALSNLTIHVAIADAARDVKITAAGIATGRYGLEDAGRQAVEAAFNEGQSGSREARYIITGNIPAGYARLNDFPGSKQVVMFRMADGTMRQGVLLSRQFRPEAALEALPVRFSEPQQVLDFLVRLAGRSIVESDDGVFSIQRDERQDQYLLKVKPGGGKPYYLNSYARQRVDGGEFVNRRGSKHFQAWVQGERNAREILANYAAQLGTTYQTDSHKEVARQITGEAEFQERPAGDAPEAEPLASIPQRPASGRSVLQNDAFWEWFGRSKVVNRFGIPLVVYHATRRAGFSVFYEGSHFGTKEQAEDIYRENARVRGRLRNPEGFGTKDAIYPVYLSIQNPKRVTDQGDESRWLEAIELAIEEGYDGLVYENTEEGNRGDDSWVAFRPEQVKSAIGNSGAFSRYDADILAAAPKGWDVAETQAWDDITPEGARALRDILQTIAGPEAVLEMTPRLGAANKGEMPDAVAWGPLVRMAYSVGQERAQWTVRHEALHVVRNLGKITDAEWSILQEASLREGWLERFGIADRYSATEKRKQQQAEEAIVEAFAQWATGNAPAPNSRVERIFVKLRQFLVRLRNALKGRGFQDAESIFRRIEAGEMGRRPVKGPTRGPESASLASAQVTNAGYGEADLFLASIGVAPDAAARARMKTEDVLRALFGREKLPSNIKADPLPGATDISAWERFLKTPERLFRRFPALSRLIEAGMKAEQQMQVWLKSLTDDYEEIRRTLRRAGGDWAKVADALVDADAEGVDYDDAAALATFMDDQDLSAPERTALQAYHQQLMKMGRLVDQHRRAMLPQVRARKAQVWSKMRAILDGARVDSAEYAKAYRRRAYINDQIKAGKGDLAALAAERDAITERLRDLRLGDAEVMTRYEALREEYDALEARLAETSIRKRVKGYFPHKFYGSWRLYRVEKGEDGEETRTEITSNQGFYDSREQAIAAAKAYLQDHPKAQLEIKPRMVTFPAFLSGTPISDASYRRLQANMEESAGLSGEDFRQAMKGIVRKRARRRVLSAAMKRTGLEGYAGFEEANRADNADKVMRTHINQLVRYVVMDRMKFRYVTTTERLGLSPYRREALKREGRIGLHDALEGWWRDLNGAKQSHEEMFDRWLSKAGVTRAVTGAAVVSGAVGGLAIAPAAGAVLAGYVGWRMHRAMTKGGDFQTRTLVGGIVGDVAHLKLGMAINIASAAVNLTQTLINTFPVLGARWTAEGSKRAAAAMWEQATTPKAEWEGDARILQRLDIATDHRFTEEQMLIRQHIGTMKRVSMFWFETAERMNRATAGLGAYYRAIDAGRSPAQALEEARKVLTDTQFQQGLANKPELLRLQAARIPTQFWNFMFQQVAFTFKLHSAAAQSGDYAPVIRFYAMLFLMAGILGLPGAGLLDWLLEKVTGQRPTLLLRQWAIEEAERWDASGTAAQILLRGMPALAGVDISGRIGMGKGFGPNSLQDATGPAVGSLRRLAELNRESAPLLEQMGAITPAAEQIRNVMALASGQEERRSGTRRNMTEYRPTTGEAVRQTIGFRPIGRSMEADVREGQAFLQERRRQGLDRWLGQIIQADADGQNDRIPGIIEEARDAGVNLTPQQVRRALHESRMTRAERDVRRAPREIRPEIQRLHDAVRGYRGVER